MVQGLLSSACSKQSCSACAALAFIAAAEDCVGVVGIWTSLCHSCEGRCVEPKESYQQTRGVQPATRLATHLEASVFSAWSYCTAASAIRCSLAPCGTLQPCHFSNLFHLQPTRPSASAPTAHKAIPGRGQKVNPMQLLERGYVNLVG